jgi:hypothetical protein
VYVFGGPTKYLGRDLSTGRVCIQQQLSKHHYNGTIQVSLQAIMLDAFELGST